ncbi:MAG: methyltransferase family protein [Beijerinckiaceae bacterium]
MGALLTWSASCVWPAAYAGGQTARTILAVIIALTGLAIEAAALWRFVVARTTVHPMRPARSSALVTSGLYRFSRNPMYVGQALLLAAFTLWLGHWAGMVAVPAFVAYITRFQIMPEERVLAAKFPQEFAAYRAQVRRWL